MIAKTLNMSFVPKRYSMLTTLGRFKSWSVS